MGIFPGCERFFLPDLRYSIFDRPPLGVADRPWVFRTRPATDDHLKPNPIAGHDRQRVNSCPLVYLLRTATISMDRALVSAGECGQFIVSVLDLVALRHCGRGLGHSFESWF